MQLTNHHDRATAHRGGGWTRQMQGLTRNFFCSQLSRFICLAFDGTLPVVANPGVGDSFSLSLQHQLSERVDRYPRLGSFEVCLRTGSGLFIPVHSKLISRRFPVAEQAPHSPLSRCILGLSLCLTFGTSQVVERLMCVLGQPPEHSLLIHNSQQLHRAVARGLNRPIERLLQAIWYYFAFRSGNNSHY